MGKFNFLSELSEGEDKGGNDDHFLSLNIQHDTNTNSNFREVLFTTKDMQLVLMSLKPGEDIGVEIHKTIDQFFRVESGQGEVEFNGRKFPIKAESAFIVPQGTKHNVTNTSKTDDLKLYSVYAPPRHSKDTVHKTKKDAEKDKEFFTGETNSK